MVSILLIVSLVLNIVALFSILLLYLRQNRLIQMEKSQERIMKEMEEFVSGCILEFKEENESFIKKLQTLDKSKEHTTSYTLKPIAVKKTVPKVESSQVNKMKEEDNSSPEKINDSDRARMKGNVYQAVQAYKNIQSMDEGIDRKEAKTDSQQAVQDTTTPVSYEKGLRASKLYTESLLNQALLLQKQGFSIEDIAKKLNKGITEIELLFKFRQNRQE